MVYYSGIPNNSMISDFYRDESKFPVESSQLKAFDDAVSNQVKSFIDQSNSTNNDSTDIPQGQMLGAKLYEYYANTNKEADVLNQIDKFAPSSGKSAILRGWGYAKEDFAYASKIIGSPYEGTLGDKNNPVYSIDARRQAMEEGSVSRAALGLPPLVSDSPLTHTFIAESTRSILDNGKARNPQHTDKLLKAIFNSKKKENISA